MQVSFTDDADNEETLTSEATAAVAGAQPTEPPDKPKGLSATASHDSVTLTWDDPGDDSITGYVILRRIPGVDPQGHFDVLVAEYGDGGNHIHRRHRVGGDSLYLPDQGDQRGRNE